MMNNKSGQNFPVSDTMLSRSVFLYPLADRFNELEKKEQAFVCIMVARSGHGVTMQLKYQMSFKVRVDWFSSRTTYHKVRVSLIKKGVITKQGQRYRYTLNPEYHPSLIDKQWKKEIEKGLCDARYKAYKAWFKELRPLMIDEGLVRPLLTPASG